MTDGLSPLELAGAGLGLLLVALLLGVAVYELGIYSVWHLTRTRHPRRWHGRLWRAAILDFLAAFTVMILGLGAQLVRRIRLHRGSPGGVPVLCVHGYTQNWGNFLLLSQRLARAGCGPVFGVNIRGKFREIEDAARQVAVAVEWVRGVTGASQVDVVCHSMGGLATRAAMARHGCALSVRRVVTLGTPHQGTLLARFGFGRNARDMRPDSRFMGELPPAPVTLTTIWSYSDAMVLPPFHAQTGGPEAVFEDVGHLALLFSSRVAVAVCRALTAPAPPPDVT